MHDAVAGRDHVHVFERGLGPVDEVETVIVSTVFNLTVLLERVLLKTGVLHGQRVIHDQLGRYHRIDLGGVTTLLGNGVTQTCEIHQSGLAKNVVAYHAGRIPGEIQVALAFDQLFQGIRQHLRIAPANQLLSQDLGGVRELVVRAGLDVFHGLASIEIVQVGTWQTLAVFSVHGRSSIGTHLASAGPV